MHERRRLGRGKKKPPPPPWWHGINQSLSPLLLLLLLTQLWLQPNPTQPNDPRAMTSHLDPSENFELPLLGCSRGRGRGRRGECAPFILWGGGEGGGGGGEDGSSKEMERKGCTTTWQQTPCELHTAKNDVLRPQHTWNWQMKLFTLLDRACNNN